MSGECKSWTAIERASDCETNRAGRVAAALHVRACGDCRHTLRGHLRVRRSIRSSFPLLPLDPVFSARLQTGLMFERNRMLQTWLRRSTAIAAAVLLFCTLSATFARSDSNAGSVDDSDFVSPTIDRATDTPQQVTRWILQDLSRG